MVIADLHIHGRYAQGCSRNTTLELLEKYARVKGIDVLGCGDFTHPFWIKEIREKLEEDENGILWSKTKFPFLWQTEISFAYSQGGRGRRVHLIVLAPSYEVVRQITDELLKRGRVDYDGRPIFGMSCIEFVDIMKGISSDIEIIPAHCLLPGTYIHSNPELRKIEKINEGDKVLTHTGKFRKVLKTYKRPYKGDVYKITPWYFREGMTTTPEHPFYAIKSFKNCTRIKGKCKPLCSQKDYCKNKKYENYAPEWISAKKLEIGDFLVYPRIKGVIDKNSIKTIDIVPEINKLKKYSRIKHIKEEILLDTNFCRLAGYYAAEGYVIGNEAIGFSFNKKEKEYVQDVIDLMKKAFGVTSPKFDDRKGRDIIYYSHILNRFFGRLFYVGNEKRAWTKSIPEFMLFLHKDKQTELLRGWWRGDYGYTVSHNLSNQMKIICIRLGIVPSIFKDSAERFNARGKHFIGERKISTNRDTFIFSNLSFFEDKELLNDRSFNKFVNKINRKHGWIDDNHIYLPIKNIEVNSYEGDVFNLEVDEDNSYVSEFAAVHNCWTPWFGVFGSKSGFDSLKEAFGEKVKDIHAIETGMSSSPAMNWRVKELDNFRILSFSDTHSYWPWRIGREATVFDCDLKYKKILNAIRTGEGLKSTVETDPNYGIYHYDGHRKCGVCLSPSETKKLKGVCPKCRRQLTIGVEYRVEELASREEGFRPAGAKDFVKLTPLSELIAAVWDIKQLGSAKVWAEYNKLIKEFGNEFNVLLNASHDELLKVSAVKLVDVIMKNRSGELRVKPGYDGIYGQIDISDSERMRKQKTLGDF